MWKRHSHAKCVDDAMKRAELLCLKHNSRLTPIRRKVLKLVWSSHKPIKAYDILAQLSTGDFIEKPPTVYRALEFLLENNLVHRIESLNAYVGCNTEHHGCGSGFFICDQCDEVEELIESELNKVLSYTRKKQGFIPNLVNIEIHGICAQCVQQ